MKKWGFVLTTLLIIASSCTLQPKPESIPVPETPTPQSPTTTPTITPTLSPVPTITPTSLPDISPVEWASSSETGVVIPQKMFPLVGAIGKKHRRTIDLDYAGLKIAVVLGEGIDLQEPGFTANQRGIRSFYAEELNEQEALKMQLEQVKATLDNKGTTQDYVVIIEGQDWPDDPLVSPPPGYISQVVLFGRIDKDEIKARYVLENGSLRQLSKEEEPQLLPELRVNGPYIERSDTGERVQLKGVNIDLWEDFYLHNLYDLVDIAQQWGSNLLRFQIDIDLLLSNKYDFEKLLKYTRERGMYCLFSVTHDGGIDGWKSEYTVNKPTDRVNTALNYLAENYKYYNNILYGLLNEPADISWSELIGWADQAIKDIRTRDSDALVVMSGLDYSGNFEYFKNKQPFNNIIYDLHYYAHIRSSGQAEPDYYNDWSWMIGKLPLLIGEAGVPGFAGGKDHELDDVYIRKVIELTKLNPNMVHYTGFTLQGPGITSLLANYDGTPNDRGKPYNDDLRDSSTISPQTDFMR